MSEHRASDPSTQEARKVAVDSAVGATIARALPETLGRDLDQVEDGPAVPDERVPEPAVT